VAGDALVPRVVRRPTSERLLRGVRVPPATNSNDVQAHARALIVPIHVVPKGRSSLRLTRSAVPSSATVRCTTSAGRIRRGLTTGPSLTCSPHHRGACGRGTVLDKREDGASAVRIAGAHRPGYLGVPAAAAEQSAVVPQPRSELVYCSDAARDEALRHLPAPQSSSGASWGGPTATSWPLAAD